jgi:hypothetical protein
MAKRSPLKVLLFLILLLVVAYLCKRGWEGFYDTAGTINIVEASEGINCGASRGNITATLQNLINGQADKYSFYHDGRTDGFAPIFGDPAPYCPKDFNIVYNCGDGNNKTIYIPSNDGQHQIIDIKCPKPVAPAPAPAAPAPAAAPSVTCPDLSAYIPKSSCTSCAAPKSCVDMTPYMLASKCLLTDDDPDPSYMLISDCNCPTCKQYRQS